MRKKEIAQAGMYLCSLLNNEVHTCSLRLALSSSSQYFWRSPRKALVSCLECSVACTKSLASCSSGCRYGRSPYRLMACVVQRHLCQAKHNIFTHHFRSENKPICPRLPVMAMHSLMLFLDMLRKIRALMLYKALPGQHTARSTRAAARARLLQRGLRH